MSFIFLSQINKINKIKQIKTKNTRLRKLDNFVIVICCLVNIYISVFTCALFTTLWMQLIANTHRSAFYPLRSNNLSSQTCSALVQRIFAHRGRLWKHYTETWIPLDFLIRLTVFYFDMRFTELFHFLFKCREKIFLAGEFI